MRNRMKRKLPLYLGVFAICMAMFHGTAGAMRFDVSEDVVIDCSVTLTYGASFRAKDAESEKIADINADDGNRNFDQWDMVNNKFGTVADVEINYKNFGALIRPKAFYDFVYMGDNAENNLATFNGDPGTSSDEFTDETRDAHGSGAEILDIYAYSMFDLGGRNLEVRVGRHALNWGESLWMTGGIGAAQNPIDGAAALAPGTQAEEVFLPTEAASLQFNLTDTVALSAYYQWRWRETKLPETGFFLSTTDMMDEAGKFLLIAPGLGLSRGADIDAKDDGQYGASLTYVADWLLDTEFGFYYLKYHEKTPMLNMDMANMQYYMTYAEDLDLYGFSFSAAVGDTNVSGEISYRPDYPLRSAVPGAYVEGNVVQAMVSAMHSTGPTPVYSNMLITAEVGFNNVSSVEEEMLSADDFAWGYRLELSPIWYEALPKLNVSLPVNYTGNPHNTSSFGGYTEDSNALSVGLSFTYDNVYAYGIRYVDYSSDNSLSDRDYIAVNFSYTF